MSAKIEVLLVARELPAGAIKKYTADLKSVGPAAREANAQLAASGGGAMALAKNLDSAGRSAKIGLGSVAQLAQFGRAELGAVSAMAGGVADAVGDIAGSFATFGPIGIAVTGVSLAVSGLIALMREQEQQAAAALERTRQHEEELSRPFIEAKKALDDLNRQDPLQGLALSIPLTAARVRELSQLFPDLEDKFKRLLSSQEGARVLEDRIATLTIQIRDIKKEIAEIEAIDPATLGPGQLAAVDEVQALKDKLREAENMLRVYTGASEDATEAQRLLKEEIIGTNEAVQNGIPIWDDAGDSFKNLVTFWDETKRAAESLLNSIGVFSDPLKQLTYDVQKELGRQKSAVSDWVSAWNSGVSKAKSIVKSIASEITKASSVTAEDMAASAAGTYVDNWDEYARRVKAIQEAAKGGEINADWAHLIPVDILNQGAAAVERWAAAEQTAFYSGQRLDQINYDSLGAGIEKFVNDAVGKFQLLSAAEQQAAQYLTELSEKDPGKFQKFLEAEGMAPDTSAVDAAKRAFGDISEGIDTPLAKAQDYVQTIDSIPNLKATLVDLSKKEGFDGVYAEVIEQLNEIPAAADIVVTLTYETQGTPLAPGRWQHKGSGPGGGPAGRASGGYVKDGLYRLGEEGEEYVLPRGMVRFIEDTLGHRITSPDEIGWLIDSLKKGPDEAAWSLQNWASGIAGWGVAGPENAGKWTNKIYDRFERQYGAELLPDAVKNSGGSAGGAGGGMGGGTTVNVSLLNVDADKLAKAIVKELKPYLEIDERALTQRLKDAINRQIGKGANMRAAMGV